MVVVSTASQALSVALKSFVAPVHTQLAAAVKDAAPVAALQTLTSSLASTSAFARSLVGLFADMPPRVLASLTHPLFQPFERFIGDYAQLESTVLTQQMGALTAELPADAASANAEALVAAAAEVPPQMQRHALAALDRCSDFTADLELARLLPVPDASAQQVLEQLDGAVAAVGSALAGGGAGAQAQGTGRRDRRFEVPPLAQEALQQLLRLPPALSALQACTAQARLRICSACHSEAACCERRIDSVHGCLVLPQTTKPHQHGIACDCEPQWQLLLTPEQRTGDGNAGGH